MPEIRIQSVGFGHWLVGALLAGGLAIVPVAAAAQVVVIVNGSPITARDVDLRAKIMGAGKIGDRAQALKDLIDDQVKISKAKSYGLEVSDKEVDEGFATMAKRQRMTPEQFNEVLQRSGIAASALKSRIRAEITWSNLVRGKFGTSLQIGDADITKELQNRNTPDQPIVGFIYTLYPVTVIVPRGTGVAIVEQKRREAENLRSRFLNCNEGLALARGLRDIAVREPVTRSSADLAPALTEILGGMQVGRLTAPEDTPQGLQMFALCDKKESTADAPIKREVREQLYTKRFETEAKKYLDEIRKQSMIEYK